MNALEVAAVGLAATVATDDETVDSPQLLRSRYVQQRPRRREATGVRPNMVCQQCGAPYYAAPSHAAGRRYCSAACRASASGYEYTSEPAYTPRLGERGFIGSLPAALALVEAQLATSASLDERDTLAIEADVLRSLLHDQEAAMRAHLRGHKASQAPMPPNLSMAQRLAERLKRRQERRQERRKQPTPPSRGRRPQASS